jgi:hypothetical protein
MLSNHRVPLASARAPNRQSTILQRRALGAGAGAGAPPALGVLRPPSLISTRRRAADKEPTAAKGKGGGAGESSSLGFKAAWVAAEALGDLVGGADADASTTTTTTPTVAPMTRSEILESIREDFEANYFLTGKGDMRAYAPDCLYADPFSSFRGTARFKKNVANFGAVVDAVKVDLGAIGPDPKDPENSVTATWRFSGVVKVLPWRPVLAAAGSTRHVVDPAKGLVVEHVEEWASSPGEVLARLWEPSNRGPPVNRWEAAFGALSSKKEGAGGLAAAFKAFVAFREPPTE